MRKSIGKLLHDFFTEKLKAKELGQQMLGGQHYRQYQLVLPTRQDCGPPADPLTYWVTSYGRIKVGRELENARDLDPHVAKGYIEQAKAPMRMATGV